MVVRAWAFLISWRGSHKGIFSLICYLWENELWLSFGQGVSFLEGDSSWWVHICSLDINLLRSWKSLWSTYFLSITLQLKTKTTELIKKLSSTIIESFFFFLSDCKAYPSFPFTYIFELLIHLFLSLDNWYHGVCFRGKLVDAYRFLHKDKDMEQGFSWSGNPIGR